MTHRHITFHRARVARALAAVRRNTTAASHAGCGGRCSRAPALLVVALIAGALLWPGAAGATPVWLDGVTQSSTVLNCPSVIQGFPFAEQGTEALTGYFADPAALPEVGQVFYVHALFVGVGNPCPGGQLADPEIALPPGVDFAIGATTPVFCFFLDFRGASPTVTGDPADCPQQPQPPSHGGSGGFPPIGAAAWAMPTGVGWEVRVPVVAHRPLIGLAASPCDCVVAPIQVLDGNSSPVLGLRAPLGVIAAPSTAAPAPPRPVAVPQAPPAAVAGAGASTGGSKGAAGTPAGGRRQLRIRYQDFWAWTTAPNATQARKLLITSAPAASRVEVSCAGGSCPRRQWTRRGVTRLNIAGLLGNARLTPGTRLGVTVTRRGYIGFRIRFTVRARNVPQSSSDCLSASSSKPIRCPRARTRR